MATSNLRSPTTSRNPTVSHYQLSRIYISAKMANIPSANRIKNLNSLFHGESTELTPTIKEAIKKADQRRFIRDKLMQYKHIDEESKEQKLHFKLLGRVGYDRLPIPDIVEISSQVCYFDELKESN